MVQSPNEKSTANFPVSIPLVTISDSPPSMRALMTATTRTRPPNRTMVWITSVQMTARIPPSNVYRVARPPTRTIVQDRDSPVTVESPREGA